MSDRRKRIGFLVFNAVTALDLVGPCEAFAVATTTGRPPGPAYDVTTIAVAGRRCAAESGVVLEAAHTLDDAPPLDTLIIPGGVGLREPKTNARVASWVKARAARFRRVASVCTGIYGLAPTGLLDGRRVTTHWNFAEDVARKFPKLRVEPNELFVKDGRFYTAAGVTSGIDLALSLIEEDLGRAAALAVARELVVYVKRAGGQEQFSEPLRFQTAAKGRLGDLAAYVAAHLERDLSVGALARQMALSSRQLTRRCNDAFGLSPAVLVQRLRLDEARSRLAEPDGNVELVAASVGFRSADSFRRAFQQQFGLNPSLYRGRFFSTKRAHGARSNPR